MTSHDLHAGLESLLAHIIQDLMHFMHDTGLSRHEIHALIHIYHAGECQVSDIGDLSGASPAAASQLVERLVQQGLVQRAEDPFNRRIKRLHLTEKSIRLLREGVTSNRFLSELMASLPERQRRTVKEAFGYLAQATRRIESSHTRKVEHHALDE